MIKVTVDYTEATEDELNEIDELLFPQKVDMSVEVVGNVESGERWAKNFLTRGLYGIADGPDDVFGFYSYLAHVIKRGLETFKNESYSNPMFCDIGRDTDDTCWERNNAVCDNECGAKWDAMLDDMIFVFSCYCHDSEWDMPPYSGWTQEWYDTSERIRKYVDPKNEFDWHVITEEEYNRYQRGMKYFTDYFGGLWI